MVAVQPLTQMVLLMLAWVTAGLAAPGVRLGSGRTAPDPLIVTPPVVSTGCGVVDLWATVRVVRAGLVDGATAEAAGALPLTAKLTGFEDCAAGFDDDEHAAVANAAVARIETAAILVRFGEPSLRLAR